MKGENVRKILKAVSFQNKHLEAVYLDHISKIVTEGSNFQTTVNSKYTLNMHV